jgi:hypothetical protein
MSSVTADSFGDFVPEPRSSRSNDQVAVRNKPSEAEQFPLVQRTPTYGQEPDVGKWPAWKVSIFVIAFCGGFWALAYMLGSKLIQLLT